MLCSDILNIISVSSDNKDIIALLSSCKELWILRFEIFYHGKTHIRSDFPLFERVTNVSVYRKTITDLETGLQKSSIPPFAKRVEINFDEPLGFLPETTTRLSLGDSFDQYLCTTLPKNLKELVVGANFDKSLENVPENLEKLFIRGRHRNLRLPKSRKVNIIWETLSLDFPLLYPSGGMNSLYGGSGYNPPLAAGYYVNHRFSVPNFREYIQKFYEKRAS